MAEYVAKLWIKKNEGDGRVPKVPIDAVTEFEAATLALEHFRQAGEQFDGESAIELLQGNVTASKPVPVKDIMYWLRNKPEGQSLVERDRLQRLLDFVKD